MKQERIKISVITICYNAEECIEDTIKSVLSQTYDNIEYVVIDGASTDRTNRIIEKYKSRISKYVSEKDKGIYDAMNKGLFFATGEWTCFMNAGDTFCKNNTVESIFNTHVYAEDVGVIYGYTMCNNKKMKLRPFFERKRPYKMGFCHQSSFVRTTIAKEMKFDLKYKIAADFNMMYNIYKKGFKFYFSDENISVFDNSGISSTNQLQMLKEVANIVGSRNSFYYQMERLKIIIKSFLR